MQQVAILGANGFIGARAVELFYLSNLCRVIPVVRSVSGLANIARFDLDWRLADALDQTRLSDAFKKCDAVVHCVAGDEKIIGGSINPVYMAAQAAGVRRLIYLSTASVHGQAPIPGTDETSPLSDKQPLPYNNAKVRAETQLSNLRARGEVEVVTLRPGIVTGPRSKRWAAGLADDLLSGKAYLIDNGAGICNSIYVDNLVHGIYLCLEGETKSVDQQAFILGDLEEVTWLDLYTRLAEALDIDANDIPRVTIPEFKSSLKDVIEDIRCSQTAQTILPAIPSKLKRMIKAAIKEATSSESTRPSAFASRQRPAPEVTLEMALLQSCRYKLPCTKAAKLLGYVPPVTFDQAMRRSIGWLSFADYPVKISCPSSTTNPQ